MQPPPGDVWATTARDPGRQLRRVDHLRNYDAKLAGLLERAQVLCHPFVIGELALGRLKRGDDIIGALRQLPKAVVADDGEMLSFIARNALAGSGIGYVDAHLLAAVRLTPDARLWTRDRRLGSVAAAMDLTEGG